MVKDDIPEEPNLYELIEKLILEKQELMTEIEALKKLLKQKKGTPDEIVLNGTITQVRDSNPETTVGNLPTRNQEIIVKLDENFWPLKNKKVKIVIDKG